MSLDRRSALGGMVNVSKFVVRAHSTTCRLRLSSRLSASHARLLQYCNKYCNGEQRREV
jgi:hypothetical protein